MKTKKLYSPTKQQLKKFTVVVMTRRPMTRGEITKTMADYYEQLYHWLQKPMADRDARDHRYIRRLARECKLLSLHRDWMKRKGIR